MTEENLNIQEKHECHCLCHSKAFRKFVTIALGSFVGVFCALSLFAALHKPPMMMSPCNCPCMYRHMPPPMYSHFDRRGHHKDFHMKKMMKENFKKDIPVKVEIED